MFTHPDDVMQDTGLTEAEKREILASWASDVHAVANAPALRRIESGAVVVLDDILDALRFLDGREPDRQWIPEVRPPAPRRRGTRLPRWLKTMVRRNRSDDDDDPPPCPAAVAIPLLQDGQGGLLWGPLSPG
jgi:hypothetical protein